MQTFLPYNNIKKSMSVLDYKCLKKQRVEAKQLFNILTTPEYSGKWLNHPIVNMWRNYEQALGYYVNCSIEEWINRGHKNNMSFVGIPGKELVWPNWLGFEKFHSSHRANLLRKNPKFYGKYGWKESPVSYYVWLDTSGKWYKQERGSNKKIYF